MNSDIEGVANENPEYKKKKSTTAMRRAARWREQGRCIKCGKVVKEGLSRTGEPFRMCEKHVKSNSRYVSRHRQKQEKE